MAQRPSEGHGEASSARTRKAASIEERCRQRTQAGSGDALQAATR